MFDYKHYVPIIRWKAGERVALRELYEDDRTGLTPLIEIPPDIIERAIGINAISRMSIGDFASRLRIEIAESWGRRLAFLDLSHLIARIASNQRNEFIRGFHKQACTIGLALVPVTDLDRTYASAHYGVTGTMSKSVFGI